MAKPNRNALVEQKRQELRDLIDQWEKENQIVDLPRERLVLKLYVEIRPPAVKTTSRSEALTLSDWEKILKVEWKDDELYILRKLKEVNNVPTLGSQLFTSSKKYSWGPNSLNIKFRRAKLPYRLIAHEDSPDGCYDIQLLHIRIAK